jgi:hypothetical protein
MHGSRISHVLLGTAVAIGMAGCGRMLSGIAEVMQSPAPTTATPSAPPVIQPVLPQASPSPTAAPTTAPTTATPTKLSFNLFGIHKQYDTVTAEVGKDSSGQPQTTIRAVDGPNTLTLIVAGSGLGEHPVTQVSIKDEKLGDKERTFAAGDPKLSASVTFTEFNVPTGIVAGTFNAAYKGFPPVSVSDGQVTAMATGGEGMTTAGAR